MNVVGCLKGSIKRDTAGRLHFISHEVRRACPVEDMVCATAVLQASVCTVCRAAWVEVGGACLGSGVCGRLFPVAVALWVSARQARPPIDISLEPQAVRVHA